MPRQSSALQAMRRRGTVTAHYQPGRRMPAKKMPKNSLPGIFQLASARCTPAPRSMNQWLTPLIHAGASCPGREALKKSALPWHGRC
jgi:hypothetical protein